MSREFECIHGLDTGTCSLCRAGRRPVYITAGGMCFHTSPRCEALAAGQAAVADRGGIPEAITTANRASAAAAGRRPCRTCS